MFLTKNSNYQYMFRKKGLETNMYHVRLYIDHNFVPTVMGFIVILCGVLIKT